MEDRNLDTPLSQSSVTLKLELIQRRCNELMDDPDALELALDEPTAADPRASDPYNRRS